MKSNQCPACGQSGTIDERRVCQSCGHVPSGVTPATVSSRSAATFFLLGVLATGMFLTLSNAPEKVDQPVPPVAVVEHQGRPQLDVVFAIDTTGSMADEIDTVKGQVRKIMRKVQAGQPRPDVRFGLVLYRDRGDEYVTRKYELTGDVQQVEAWVQSIIADGGGDTPEAVAEALHVAVQDMNWNFDQRTSRMLFLLGDAAPQRYQDGYDYRTEMAAAREKGIKVSTWGCSGIVDSGESEFREMAEIGGGSFDFLTYSQQVVRDDGARVNVVFRGDKCFEVGKDEDWKAGAAVVNKRGKSISSREVKAPSAAFGASYSGKRYRAAKKASLENNLDRAISDQLMNEAKARGVSY